jgi:hypothetical protein
VTAGDYAQAEIAGPSEALVLEPADTRLLIESLDELLDTQLENYRAMDDTALPAAALADRMERLAELRDAIHSAVTDYA